MMPAALIYRQLLTTSLTVLVNSSRCTNAPSSSASSWSITPPARYSYILFLEEEAQGAFSSAAPDRGSHALCSFLTQNNEAHYPSSPENPAGCAAIKSFSPSGYTTKRPFCREIRCFCVNWTKCSVTRGREAPTSSARSPCRTGAVNRIPPRRLGTPKFSLKSSKTSARRSSSVQPMRLEQRNGTRSQRPKKLAASSLKAADPIPTEIFTKSFNPMVPIWQLVTASQRKL